MKKAFFFGLCLVNIAFFVWEFRRGALNAPIDLQSSLPTILLAEEMDRARRGAELSSYLDKDAIGLQRLHKERLVEKPIAMLPIVKPKANSQAADQNYPVMCSEIGPFTDQLAAANWMASRSLRGQMIYKDLFTPSDYQVYYPPAKTVEQTRIQKLMLNAKGFTDIWQIPGGELKGAYSLGVFSDLARATVYKNQLAEQGVKAEIVARQKKQPRLFVRIKSVQKISIPPGGALTSAGCIK